MTFGGWSSHIDPPVEEVTEKYLPADLEQRGIALPLTTRPVAYARLREGKKGLEVILPGFADKLIAHVIPYNKLHEIVSLSVFDRALLEELHAKVDLASFEDGGEANKVELTPSLVRDIAMKLGESGLGGVYMMHRAREKKIIQANLQPAILNSVANDLIGRHGTPAASENINMATPEGLKEAELELERFGNMHRTDGATMLQRVISLSKLMARYKGPEKGMDGPIGKIMSRMDDMGNDLRKWLIPEPVEEAEMAQRTSLAVQAFIKATAEYTKDLDMVFENLDSTLAHWNLLEDKLTQIMDRLDLLIDGWERIMDARDKSLTAQRFVQRDVLAGFAPFLPILPKDLLEDDHKAEWLELRQAQLRWMNRISYMKDMKDEAENALQNTTMEVL